jgi:hypothetical protein
MKNLASPDRRRKFLIKNGLLVENGSADRAKINEIKSYRLRHWFFLQLDERVDVLDNGKRAI